jgi:hypothetical protein
MKRAWPGGDGKGYPVCTRLPHQRRRYHQLCLGTKGLQPQGGPSPDEGIYDTALRIFKASAELGIPTYLAANQAAEDRISSMRAAGMRF